MEVVMKNSYVEWVKDNWQKSAILILIYTLVSILPLYSRLDLVEFMLLLAFPLYLAHEIEEYISTFPFKMCLTNFIKANL